MNNDIEEINNQVPPILYNDLIQLNHPFIMTTVIMEVVNDRIIIKDLTEDWSLEYKTWEEVGAFIDGFLLEKGR